MKFTKIFLPLAFGLIGGFISIWIVDFLGEKKMDTGGGICQISSALNMAARKAELNITERHDHKHEVPYEVLGNDAAVFYNVQDFKFINNKNAPVKLEVIINGADSVITNIYIKEK